MKKIIPSRLTIFAFTFIFALSFISCITEDLANDDIDAIDPIAGKWFLISVNDTDVTGIECYKDSFIESDAKNITFFIQDRLENGTCETVFDNRQTITNEEGFYYLGDEVIEINISGDKLTWRVDVNTSLVFKK
ncbi:MAG: hypothetical protein AB8B65_04900 [Kordia sp.]|uniref:hypothetical protein n=1 Tax=Kordia sp. TaxID=1965332 RepID=UPI00385C8FDB